LVLKNDYSDYKVLHEGDDNIVRVNCENIPEIPSLEDSEVCMESTCDKLIAVKNASKIVFAQRRDYEYDYMQTNILKEIGDISNEFQKQKENLFSEYILHDRMYDQRYQELQHILFGFLKRDPIGAYVKIKRLLREERIMQQKIVESSAITSIQKYIQLLTYLFNRMDQTKLITLSKPYIEGYNFENRDIYRYIFKPIIRPDFMYTKLARDYPRGAEELDSYVVGDTDVTIFRLPGSVQYMYHLLPPEFNLDEEKYNLLDTARRIMSEHKPDKSEFTDPHRMREIFFNVGGDLIAELALTKGMSLTQKELNQLTKILIRYTVGFGLIENLLMDEKVQDVSVNSPQGVVPIFIVHGDYDDCVTNIVPTRQETDSWSSKLRLLSGRPFDEANPLLDTELSLDGVDARVSAITRPLNPFGLGFSFRRHRDKPWTLPLFVKYKTITPFAAGLWSFLIDGNKTQLIAGTRSSGKSSLLSAVLVEIMRRYRIITIEDTLELPTVQLRKLGYNIQPLKVASAFAKTTSEMNAEDGIRATLRLGDSALFVGEVRSKEAKALYEAMRVGAAANVVAGTIHGDSPYGVFDRVCNDIGVPKTSFKASDILIIANPVRSADGLHKMRRVTQITEVRKHWEDDPVAEGGFVDLMKYDAKTDQLLPTDDLLNGDSEVLKDIAGRIKEFTGDWDAVWDNILLRGKLKETLVNYAAKAKNADLLEAEFTIRCNDMYHIISGQVINEVGFMDSKRIFYEWDEWLKEAIRKEAKPTL
jgi:type IV secretory pathway ATPase VirB11/archaellum biosynthesis ATPase